MLAEEFSANFARLEEFLEGKNDLFLAKLRELYLGSRRLSAIAHHHDLSAETPGNGFRSFIKIVAIYFRKIIGLLEGTPSRKSFRKLHEYEMVSSGLIKVLKFLDLLSGRHPGLGLSDYLEDDSIDRKIAEAVLAVNEKDIMPFMTEIQNFWLCPSLRRVMNQVMQRVVVLKTTSPKLKMRALFDRQVRAEVCAQFALNATTNQVKNVWSAGEDVLNRTIIGVKYSLSQGSMRSLFIERQTEWVLSKSGKLNRGLEDGVELAHDAFNYEMGQRKTSLTSSYSMMSENNNQSIPLNGSTPFTVKCMYIHYGKRGVSPNDSLLLHIHGGGYVALSPKSHEPYLRYWSKRLRVPIISIDYGLSPENKYPSALQEILDVYLFLVSGKEKVVDLLGFQPKRVVLCGDSAGGNLSMSLTLVLNDMRQLNQSDIQLPTALCIQYPCANPALACHSASRLFVAIDSLLNISSVYICAASYLDVGVNDDGDQKPWYRSDSCPEVIRSMVEKSEDPYVNVLKYDRLEELQDLALFIQASEFDPLLDDSVAIARSWKGKVTLDIIPDVLHGFLAFKDFSQEAQAACDLCVERLAQALGL